LKGKRDAELTDGDVINRRCLQSGRAPTMNSIVRDATRAGKRKEEGGGDPRLFVVGSVLVEGLGFGSWEEIGRWQRMPCGRRRSWREEEDDRWGQVVSVGKKKLTRGPQMSAR
jgi:hypothetical protein